MDLEATTRRLAATLRALRGAHGLSIGALKHKAGLAKSTVANIESGEGNPSLEVLWRLAGALDVPLSTLPGVETRSTSTLIRAGQGALIESPSGVRGRLLVASDRPQRTEVLSLDFTPEIDYHAEGHASGTEEVIYCIKGSLHIGPTGHEVTLYADAAHRYRAPTGARALLIMQYQPMGR